MWRYFVTLGLLSALAGCGDPLLDMPRLAEVELSEASETAQIAAPSQDQEEDTRPIFARIFGAPDTPEPEPTPADEALREVFEGEVPPAEGEAADAAESDGGAVLSDDAAAEEAPLAKPETAAEPEVTEVSKAGMGGLFGLFNRRGSEVSAEARAPMAEAEKIAPEGEVLEASLSPAPEPQASPLRGLFSRNKAKALSGPDAQIVAPGTPVPFGKIVRVCDLKRTELGKQVERSGGGKGKYRLYDSIPNSTAMRPFYITGFDDGCPRQVSAALAIFASASHYETLRANDAVPKMSKGEAHKAYAKARRQTCRARVGKSCSDARKLEKETAFLTVYDRFGSSQNWRDILLHDGAVLAMD